MKMTQLSMVTLRNREVEQAIEYKRLPGGAGRDEVLGYVVERHKTRLVIIADRKVKECSARAALEFVGHALFRDTYRDGVARVDAESLAHVCHTAARYLKGGAR